MCFLIFQLEDVYNLHLSFNKCQPINAYKYYTYKNECIFHSTCDRFKW